MTYKNLLLSLLLNLSLLSLPMLSIGQQTINGYIIHDNLERDFILYIPASYSASSAVPLLFNFHGYTSNAFEQMNYGDFRDIADTAGFIIVHPMGTEDALGNTHWNVGWGGSTVDDIGFASALLDSISLDFTIDQERVYSTGMSNGGFISYKLACDLSDRIAAIASVTGSMNVDQTNSCNCQHPTPIMEIHGTADATVPYNGSSMFETVENVVSYWVDFNSCETDPLITLMPDLEPNDGSTVLHYLYANGQNGVEVQHYKIINGTHTWPGSIYDFGVTNYDIDASVEIWKFFSRYDIYGLINTTSTNQFGEKELAINIYPNPSSSYIIIDNNLKTPVNYQIISPIGELLQAGVINSNHYKISLSAYAGNLCFLRIEGKAYRIIVLK